MATRNIVPRANGEGGIGTAAKHWGAGHFDTLPNWQEYLAESTGYGIVSGCEPTISGLTVTVGAGIIHLADGTRKELSATNITLDSADSTNPRIDLVYTTSAGAVAKITGTAAATPSAPSVPTDGISIAHVSVAANASTGTLTANRDVLYSCANSVVEMKKMDIPIGAIVHTRGYYSTNDGGSADYLIRSNNSDTDDGGSIIILNNGNVAELLNIKTSGYIDLRWFGAKADGVTDCATALSNAIKYSNDNYITPIKIIGEYYLGTGLSFTGSLCLEGVATPGRIVLSTTNRPETNIAYYSTLKIAAGITAFSIKGIGTDGNYARMTEIFLSDTEFIGTNTSKLMVVDAFGAPSRLSWIKRCKIHEFNTVFESILDLVNTPNVSTLISNFEVCNNEIYNNSYVFNVVGGPNNPTFCGLNIHDNCLEWNSYIVIEHLFGYNVIKNNLMENSTGEITLSVSRGRLNFDGNYFEGNTGNINITGASPSTCEVSVDYIHNVGGAIKLNIGSAYFSKLNHINMDIKCSTRCVFGVEAMATIMNLPISAFDDGEYVFPYLQKTDANDVTVRGEDAVQTSINRVPVSSANASGIGLNINGVPGYDSELAITTGDKMIMSYYKPTSVEETFMYVGGSDGDADYGLNSILYLKGLCVYITTALKNSASARLIVGRIDANKPISIGPVTFKKTSDTTKKLKEFAAVENNNASFYD